MEDDDAEIHSTCYLIFHDILVEWLRPIIQDLVRLHGESTKVIRKRKKNPGAMVRDFDVLQVLELRGVVPRDTYFRRLQEGRVLKSDSVLLGGEEPEEGEETPYGRAMRKIFAKEDEGDSDEDAREVDGEDLELERRAEEEVRQVEEREEEEEEDERLREDDVDDDGGEHEAGSVHDDL